MIKFCIIQRIDPSLILAASDYDDQTQLEEYKQQVLHGVTVLRSQAKQLLKQITPGWQSRGTVSSGPYFFW